MSEDSKRTLEVEMNFKNRTLWTADNLDVMRGMNTETVDLIYLDPPFNSKRDYAAPIGSQAAGAAFSDTWSLDDIKTEHAEELQASAPELWHTIVGAGFTAGDSMQAYLTYMSIRLIEMRRILKLTGSIYLHCDPTASHYLKQLMDAVFGRQNFRNEIVWRRSGSHNYSNRFGPIHDVLLFYCRTDDYRHRSVFTPYLRGHVNMFFKQEDANGRYWTNAIHGSGTRRGASGTPWRGFDPTAYGRHWAVPRELVTAFGIDPALPQHEKLDALYELGLIDLPANGGLPTYRQYLGQSPGQLLQDIWAFQPHTKNTLHKSDLAIDEDVRWIPPHDKKERTGYPTQKPLGLLSRIIRSSSGPDEMVFDPFCGCATTMVAAEMLGRQWVGCDIEPLARDLVVQRLQDNADAMPLFNEPGPDGLPELPTIHHLTSPPKRTDPKTEKRSRNIKQVLYHRQEGRCVGKCGNREFPIDIFEIDHIIPRSKGGADVDSNLQLLCPTCNSSKGNRAMKKWLSGE